jgi:nucleoside-diphosphate-sugar epimerase
MNESPNEGARVFLAGGTGVVGRRALPALVAAGHRVTAVARGEAKADQVRKAGGSPVAVDLFDAAAVRDAVAGHDVVVNLATAIPPLAKAARASAWALNDRIRREVSAHLVDAALAAGAERYVQESICFPYLDAGDAWIDEDAPRSDELPFAGAAVAESHAARFGAARDGHAAEAGSGAGVVLRFAQFYAPEAGHTVAFDRVLRRRVNPWMGPADAYVSLVHAEDAGAAVVAALGAPGGVYNVADDEPLTRAEAGRAAAARLGVGPPRALPGPLLGLLPGSAKLLMRSQRVSNRRFREASGWAPAHPSIRSSWPTADASTAGVARRGRAA